MKHTPTFFLKTVLILIAVGVLTCLLWFPKTEGRAANLDLIHIYSDPLIIYTYVASIPFFVGVYQAIKLLNLIEANQAFSQSAVDTLKNMKLASLTLIGFIVTALLYIRFLAPHDIADDPAGPTMLGIAMSLACTVIATGASVFQKLLQNAVDIKTENDLTV